MPRGLAWPNNLFSKGMAMGKEGRAVDRDKAKMSIASITTAMSDETANYEFNILAVSLPLYQRLNPPHNK